VEGESPLSEATLRVTHPRSERLELVPRYIDTALVTIPPDNPALNPARLADLEASIRDNGQLVLNQA
jgi:hypothetical protein